MLPIISRRHAVVGWVLVALFAFRVAAQPLSLAVHAGLPPFESWHSAALPYGVLLASQLAILGAFGWATYRFGAGGLTPRRSLGVAALWLGGIYFAAMTARLVLGVTLLRDVRWFASPIPTVFHLVLAGWILLFGHFHRVFAAARRSGR